MSRDPFHPRKAGRQSRARETVEAILQASAQIVAKQGLTRLNTNHIAEIAGVSIGSLYQYFPGKDAVLQALIEREFSRTVDALLEQIEAIDPTRISLDQAIVQLVDLVLDGHVPRRPLYREVVMAVLSFKHLRFTLENDDRIISAVCQKLDAYEEIDHERKQAAMATAIYALKGVQFGLLFSDRLKDDPDLRARLCRLVRAVIT